jgi:putative NADPH-quinone reductase
MSARRVLVVFSHPVPESLVSAAKGRAMAALVESGHDVQLIDLYADGFDPVLSRDAWRHHGAPASTKPDIAEYAAKLHWADTLVFVYPTWFGGQPAMLKGWFDRVFTNGVAFDLHVGSRRAVRGRLRNIRRIVVVTTHGSGKFTNSLQGEPGKRVILRGMRLLCHPLARGSWVALYETDRHGPGPREAFLDRVESAMKKL